MIKEKDKLIGKLQSENKGKEFVELNSIQEKVLLKLQRNIYSRTVNLLEMQMFLTDVNHQILLAT